MWRAESANSAGRWTVIPEATSPRRWAASGGMRGNVAEWNDAMCRGASRGCGGGSFGSLVYDLWAATVLLDGGHPKLEGPGIGFRVSEAVP